MSDVHTWDTTDADNDATPPDGFPENMDYDDVNDSGRAVMGAVRRLQADETGATVSTGSGGAYALLANQDWSSSIPTGMIVSFRANHTTSSGASTLNVSSSSLAGSALDLELPDGGDPVITQDGIYRVRYDDNNTRWVVISATEGRGSTDLSSNVVGSVTLDSSRVGRVLNLTGDTDFTIPASAPGNGGFQIRIANPAKHDISFDMNATGGSQNRLYFSFTTGFIEAPGIISFSGTGASNPPYFTLTYLSTTTGNYILSDY